MDTTNVIDDEIEAKTKPRYVDHAPYRPNEHFSKTSMDCLRSKFPDRKFIHEAIDQVKELGYLKPMERRALVIFTLSVVKQSIVVDGEAVSDLELLNKTLDEVKAAETVNVDKAPRKRLPIKVPIPPQPINSDPPPVVPTPVLVTSDEGNANAWINNGTKTKQVPVGSLMPVGWVLGRITTPGLVKAQQAATAAAALVSKVGKANAGSHWYTDGKLNVIVKEGANPPPGFAPGRHFDRVEKPKLAANLGEHAKPKAEINAELFGDSHWYNNGVKRVRVPAGSPPPEGDEWKPGSGGSWYTNGSKHILVNLGEEPPPGFVKGRMEAGQWWNNGSQNVRVKNGEQPPEGYQPGLFIADDKKARTNEGRRNGAAASPVITKLLGSTPV